MSGGKKARKLEKAKLQAQEAFPTATSDRLSDKDYERELAKLHVELVKLQQWV